MLKFQLQNFAVSSEWIISFHHLASRSMKKFNLMRQFSSEDEEDVEEGILHLMYTAELITSHTAIQNPH